MSASNAPATPRATRPSATPGKTAQHLAAPHRFHESQICRRIGGPQSRASRYTATPLGPNPILKQAKRHTHNAPTTILKAGGAEYAHEKHNPPPCSRPGLGERHTYRAACIPAEPLGAGRLAHANPAEGRRPSRAHSCATAPIAQGLKLLAKLGHKWAPLLSGTATTTIQAARNS